MLIWNLPLHGWCWNLILEMVKPVGDLVALSQTVNPHKWFISTLVRRRAGFSLPFEVELRLGMRKYTVLIAGEREDFPVFRWDICRYVLHVPSEEVERRPERKCTHEIPSSEKGKQHVHALKGKQQPLSERTNDIGMVELGFHPDNNNGCNSSVGVTARVGTSMEKVVEPSSHCVHVTADYPKMATVTTGGALSERMVVEPSSHGDKVTVHPPCGRRENRLMVRALCGQDPMFTLKLGFPRGADLQNLTSGRCMNLEDDVSSIGK